MVVPFLGFVMVFVWWSMHSMLHTSLEPPAAAAAAAPLASSIEGTSVLRGSPQAKAAKETLSTPAHPLPISPAHAYGTRPTPSLTPLDVQRLARVLGAAGPNVTRAHFVTVPDWISHLAVPPSPCLLSPLTGYNVYLFEDGWRDAAPAEQSGGNSARCPDPEGGQVPLKDVAEAPEVSVALAFRNSARDTIKALLAIIQNAAQVASVEVLLLDIASNAEEAAEVKAFVQHVITHLGLRLRLFRFADPLTASLSKAVTKAASSLATGKLLLILNCDVVLQPGSLRALVAVFETHPAAGMAVPKLLQSSGAILDSGGLVFSDGSGWQYGRDEPSDKPQYNYVRPTDYGSSYCVMVVRSLFVELNLYSPSFSPAWYDDTDAAFAIRQAGYTVWFTPFAEVVVSETADLVLTQSKPKLLEDNRRKFQSKWQSVLSCHYLHETVQSQYDAYIAATRLSTFRLLFLDWIVPEPDRDSGSIRTINMLQTLLAMRVHVTFAPLDSRRDPAYTVALRYMGVEVVGMKDLEWPRSESGQGCRYDLILVARREVYDEVFDKLQTVCLSAPKVFDTVDLHFMREIKEQAFKQSGASEQVLKAVFGKNWNKNTMTAAPQNQNKQLVVKGEQGGRGGGGASSQARELKYIANSKVTVVVSDVETAEIRKHLPKESTENIVRLSNIHANLDAEVTPLPFERRRGCVFVGNWNHLPNRDAVLWFAREILPLVHTHASVAKDESFVFHVIGANNLPPEILNLNNTRMDGVLRIIVHGFVEDLREFYGRTRISVAPLRWGAGVKGKINSSMKYGVPVVCTSVSVEGMFAINRENILATEADAQSFADATAELYSDPVLWETVRAGGILNVREHFSLSNAAGGIAEMLEKSFAGEERVGRQLQLGGRALLMGQCGAR